MSAENEFALKGVVYVAVDEEIFSFCIGCAFVETDDDCINLNRPCTDDVRADGRNIIWKKKLNGEDKAI